jgi:hypothetical protein
MTIEEARGFAATAWCTPETEHIQMDTRLAEAFAKILMEHVNDPGLPAYPGTRECETIRDEKSTTHIQWKK